MSRWCGVGCGFAALAVWVVACAGAPPNTEAPATAAAANERPSKAPAPASEVLPTPDTRENPPATTASAPPPAPATPILPICLAKCDKLVNKCGASAVESCRLNCGKYDPPPAGCGEQVRAALECARDAKDLTCANVAPESCSRKFREIASCAAGEAAAPAEKAPAGLPDGWEQVSDAANGFSTAMPSGSVVKAGPEGPVRSVTAADTVYTVSVLPLLKDKPSEKSFLHFLMKVQGRCSDKVKLDGFIEKAGRSSIHYKAHCPDKTDWNGMIFSNDQHLFLLSAQAPLGKLGITEPFFYQFQFSAR